jgi:hypothetical protein
VAHSKHEEVLTVRLGFGSSHLGVQFCVCWIVKQTGFSGVPCRYFEFFQLWFELLLGAQFCSRGHNNRLGLAASIVCLDEFQLNSGL